MTAKVLGRAEAALPRGGLVALFALLVVAALVAAHALGPYLFGKITLQNELAVQLRATSGLGISVHHARFSLLPWPRVTADEVRIEGGAGAVRIDAVGMIGDVRLLPLVVGRVELSAVTLLKPAAALDLTKGPATALLAPDSTIGQALLGREGRQEEASQRLGSLVLQDGTVRIARRGATPLVLSDLDAAVDWMDLNASATLTGSIRLGGERVDLALWLGSPSALPRGGSSAVVVHAHASSFDVAANGALDAAGADDTPPQNPSLGFRGHVTGNARALGALLARAAPGMVLPAQFADASLDADTRVAADGDGLARLDLQKLVFRADGNGWEGTLAFRRAPSPLISATLATDRLMLASFVAELPSAFGPGRIWSRAPLPPPHLGDVDLDLRLSAAQLGYRPFTIDDAALSVISRKGRLEVALIDGRLSGGTVKGRLSIGRTEGVLDLHGNASLAAADAAALSWDAAGWQLASGPLSAALGLQSRGTSIAALVDGLDGSGRATLGEGEVSGLDGRGSRTPVRSINVAAQLVGGVATIDEAAMLGSGLTVRGGGMVDLRTRTLDLQTPGIPAGGGAARSSRITVAGPFDAPVVRTVDQP